MEKVIIGTFLCWQTQGMILKETKFGIDILTFLRLIFLMFYWHFGSNTIQIFPSASQILQKKHEDFAVELAAGEERVVTVETLAKSLLDDDHSDGLAIQERLDNLRQLWADLNELMQLRREVRTGRWSTEGSTRKYNITVSFTTLIISSLKLGWSSDG